MKVFEKILLRPEMINVPKLNSDFCNSADVAYTLPAKYYVDQSVFDYEKEKIFANHWVCVAHCSELTAKNSYVTREIIGENIIVIRDREGELRSFYNVCPHRGHQLLSGSGVARNVITCPYHAWAFKLDGQLSSARNCGNVVDFEHDRANLVPLKVEEYGGFVFINMNLEAEPVATQLPGLAERINDACPVVGQLKLAARFVSVTSANWKSIVDNYLECYHCAPAHPGFADSVQVDKYKHTVHGNWTLQFGLAKPSERSFNFKDGEAEASFSGFWAWPCTMFNMPPVENCMTAIFEFPIDADTTLQHYEIYFLNDELTEDQKALIDWYRDVFRPEDLGLVESVQKGLKSRGYRGQGRIMTDRERTGLSEHGIAHFHHLMAQQYQF